jgi:hypothetical protein
MLENEYQNPVIRDEPRYPETADSAWVVGLIFLGFLHEPRKKSDQTWDSKVAGTLGDGEG